MGSPLHDSNAGLRALGRVPASGGLTAGRRRTLLACVLVAQVAWGPSAQAQQRPAGDPANTAAEVRLDGVVLDAGTGEPIERAVVTLPARGRATLSARDGSFTVPSADAGGQVVRVQRAGYQGREIFVSLTEEAPVLEVLLEPRPEPAAGEEIPWARNMDLTGRVFDGGSGRPLPDVALRLETGDAGVASDSVGGVRFPGVPTGPQELRVDRVGYQRQVIELILGPDVLPVDIVLIPDSAVLTGLPALDDALRGRRNYHSVPVQTLNHAALARAEHGDALRAVDRMSRATVVPCPGGASSFSCVYRRGRPAEPLVCIDGVPLQHGLDELQRYRPHELYLVEVYGVSGTTIRAYTYAHVEQLARRGAATTYGLSLPSPGTIVGLGTAAKRPPSALAEQWGHATC